MRGFRSPPSAIYPYVPAGQCTRTTLAYVPFITGGGPGLGTEVGSLFDCLGVTTAGQWVQTNGVPRHDRAITILHTRRVNDSPLPSQRERPAPADASTGNPPSTVTRNPLPPSARRKSSALW